MVFLAKGGYFAQMFNCVKSEVTGNRAVPTQVSEATEEPEISEEPTQAPTDSPEETPDIGTPEPETPTPPALEVETPAPSTTSGSNTISGTAFEGLTIGIDPTRDGGSKYKNEGEYNLSLAKELAKLEARKDHQGSKMRRGDPPDVQRSRFLGARIFRAGNEEERELCKNPDRRVCERNRDGDPKQQGQRL